MKLRHHYCRLFVIVFIYTLSWSASVSDAKFLPSDEKSIIYREGRESFTPDLVKRVSTSRCRLAPIICQARYIGGQKKRTYQDPEPSYYRFCSVYTSKVRRLRDPLAEYYNTGYEQPLDTAQTDDQREALEDELLTELLNRYLARKEKKTAAADSRK